MMSASFHCFLSFDAIRIVLFLLLGEVDKQSTYLLGALYPFEKSLATPASPSSVDSTINGIAPDETNRVPRMTEKKIPGIPSPSFVRLRSPLMPSQQPGDPIRWKFLKMEAINAPCGSHNERKGPSFVPMVNILDEPLKALSLELQPVTEN